MRHAARHAHSASRSAARVAALAVALLVGAALGPVAVHAADSLVTIVGPGGTQAKGAKVTAGRLQVGDAKGPLTVDGTVQSRPAVPSKPTLIRTLTDGVQETTVFQSPKGSTRLAVSSLTITNQGSSRDSFDLALRPHCDPNETAVPIYQMLIPPLTTVHLPLPTPLVVGHLQQVWCLMGSSGAQLMTVTVVGFTA